MTPVQELLQAMRDVSRSPAATAEVLAVLFLNSFLFGVLEYFFLSILRQLRQSDTEESQ